MKFRFFRKRWKKKIDKMRDEAPETRGVRNEPYGPDYEEMVDYGEIRQEMLKGRWDPEESRYDESGHLRRDFNVYEKY